MREKRSGSALKLLTYSMLFLTVGYALCYNIIGVTMNPMIAEFALTGAAQGMMNSMIQFGSIIALIIAPMMQGRVKKLRIIIVSGVIQVLMLALTGAAKSHGMLLLASALLGIGYTFMDDTINSYMVDLHPGDSATLSLTHGCFGIGGLLTPVLVTALINDSGWRSAYYVSALIFAGFCVVFAAAGLGSRKHIGEHAAAKEAPLTRSMLKEYIGNRRNVLLLCAAVFFGVAQMGVINWVSYYMVNRFDAAQIGSWCISAYWITCALSRIFAPRLPFAPRKTQAWGAVIAGCAHLLAVVIGKPEAMLIASGVIGITSGLCLPVLISEAAIGNGDRTSLTTSAIFLSMCAFRMIMNPVLGAASVNMTMLIPALCSVACGIFGFMANRCRAE